MANENQPGFVDQLARDLAREALARIEKESALTQQARQATLDRIEDLRREAREANLRVELNVANLSSELRNVGASIGTEIAKVTATTGSKEWAFAASIISLLLIIAGVFIYPHFFPSK